MQTLAAHIGLRENGIQQLLRSLLRTVEHGETAIAIAEETQGGAQ